MVLRLNLHVLSHQWQPSDCHKRSWIFWLMPPLLRDLQQIWVIKQGHWTYTGRLPRGSTSILNSNMRRRFEGLETEPSANGDLLVSYVATFGSQPVCKTDLSWHTIPKQLLLLLLVEILDQSSNTCSLIFWLLFPWTKIKTKIKTLWNLWHEFRDQQMEVKEKSDDYIWKKPNKKISYP